MSSVTNDRLIVAVRKEDGTISNTIADVPIKDLVGTEPGKPFVSVTFDPETPKKGDMVLLDGTKSKPGKPTSTIVSYEWSSPDTALTVLEPGKAQFVYPDKPQVAVTLKITDSENLQASATGIIKMLTDKPEAVIEPRNPEGKKNQEVILESKSKNYTRLLWSVSTKLFIKDGIKDQPKVTVVLPGTIESGLNVDLKAINDANDEDNDSVEIKMIDDQPGGTEVKIPITGSSASSADTGKESTKAHDGDIETRWSADGKGQWIELNFNKTYKVTKVKLTGFHYDKAYMFNINGKDFTNPANRSPGTLQEYDLKDLNITANKLKITGNGNSGSNYNSYREIEVYGIPTDGPQPVECPDPNQCKDTTTQQCRAIGPNEEKGPDGYCKLKDTPQPGNEILTNRVIAFADNDTTTGAKSTLAQIMKVPGVTQYCFVGDGPYASRGTAWVNMMKEYFNTEELMNKLLLYRGNHDTASSESWQTQEDINAWYGRYTTPDGLWLHGRQVGNVYFLVMDTEDPDVNFRDRTQHNFVKEKIAEAKQLFTEKKINWIIAGSHKPWFTLKGSSSHDPYTSVRNLYMDLFKNFVDNNLHGHNHNFQYWKPMIPNESDINGEGTELYSLAADGKSIDFDKERGWPTTIVGGSGHEWNKINDGPGIPHVWHHRDGTVGGSNKFGFAQIDFYYNPETKIHRMNVKDIDYDGKVLFEYNAIKAGEGTIPQPGEAKADLKVADTLLANTTANKADASASVYDPGKLNLDITSSENVIVRSVNEAIKEFDIPDKDNFSIGFNLKAQKGTSIKQVSMQRTVQRSGPQPGGPIIWDSNKYLKTGQAYTISGTHGNQGDDGKGVFTAASGSPKVEVDADGTFHLVCKPGHGRMYGVASNHNSVMKGKIMIENDAIDSCTLRLRTRHNEGGDCSNRFGGFGCSIYQGRDKEYEFDTESCHNNHENNKKKAWTPETSISVGKWYEFEYSVCDDSAKKIVRQRLVVKHPTTTLIWNETHNSPQAYYMDEALHNKRSMFWLRMNNASQDGRIAFKDVVISKLNAGDLDP